MGFMSTAHHERECKLDAPSDAVLARVKDYVLSHPKIFTPVTRSPHHGVPKSMRGKFSTPMEITEPRIRLYWDDVNLTAQKHGIEIRQEPRPKGGIKQMIKVAGAKAKGPVMDRMEHSANLDHFGLDFDEVRDDTLRDYLKTLLGRKIMKPVICMVSQRLRLNYHPGGNPDVLIELGIDAPCHGYAFDGFNWHNPQIELELVYGPSTKILEREAALLRKLFDLAPTTSSKPAVGFKHLQTLLAKPEGRRVFAGFPADKIWWTGQ